jgi:unsaturated rhamnogalacturonyl hydrolase
VKNGGVLLMLGNDFGNAEFDNWNGLAREFGIEFNKDNKNLVKNDVYEQGRVSVAPGNPIFKNARELFLKEISTQKLSGKARPVLEWNGDVVMSTVKHGKGTVFALGDPWLYNEYVDGRKMNGLFQNNEAARELSAWLLQQAGKK